MSKKKNELVIIDEPKEIKTVSINAEMLISKAIEKNIPLESLERLLAMRRELKAEYSREQYFKALSDFQKECPIIKKDKIIYDRDKQTKEIKLDRDGNKIIRYSYAPLESIVGQVKDLLQKYGFSYTMKSKQTKTAYTSVCETHHIEGHTETTEFEVPIDFSAYMNEIQKVGNSSTYADRYSFRKAFGILTGDDDDDANNITPEKEDNRNFKKESHEDIGKKVSNVSKAFNQSEKKKEVIQYAYQLTKKLKKDQLQYFKNLVNSTEEYTEEMFKMDINCLKIIELEEDVNE